MRPSDEPFLQRASGRTFSARESAFSAGAADSAETDDAMGTLDESDDAGATLRVTRYE